jgi:hypothetical protein
MSGIIQEIRDRMARYPHAELGYDGSSITYYPPGPEGFVVRLLVKPCRDAERYFVYYGGCRQEEWNQEGSIVTFGFGLSTAIRLRVFSRNREPYHWITDYNAMRGWTPEWETYTFCGSFWRFWRPAEVQCLQNRLIDLGGSGCGGGCAVA